MRTQHTHVGASVAAKATSRPARHRCTQAGRHGPPRQPVLRGMGWYACTLPQEPERNTVLFVRLSLGPAPHPAAWCSRQAQTRLTSVKRLECLCSGRVSCALSLRLSIFYDSDFTQLGSEGRARFRPQNRVFAHQEHRKYM